MAKGDTTQNMPNAVAGQAFRPPFYQGFGQPPNSMFPSGGGLQSPQQGGTFSASVGPSPQGLQGMLGFLGPALQNLIGNTGKPIETLSAPPMTVPGSPGSIAPSGNQMNMMMDRYRNKQI